MRAIRSVFSLLLLSLLAAVAHAQVLLDSDNFDATGGGFNSTPGTFFNFNQLTTAVYTAASTDPFETAASAGIPNSPGNPTYLGRVQWGVAGQDELQPLMMMSNEAGPIDELYLSMDFYMPTGFRWCGGKLFRIGRQELGQFVGAWISYEGNVGAGEGLGGDPDVDPVLFFGVFGTATDSQYGNGVTYSNDGGQRAMPPRDQWNNIAVYAKWNTYDGATANADGVLKLFFNGVEQTSVSLTDVVYSTSAADAGGFNTWIMPLNMSYSSCGGNDENGAVWIAQPRIYDGIPTAIEEMSNNAVPVLDSRKRRRFKR